MAGGEVTIEILNDIRDEIRGVRSELVQEIRGLREDTNQRFHEVETAILDLAQQNRFIVSYTRALAERHADVEPHVSALEDRVGKLESKEMPARCCGSRSWFTRPSRMVSHRSRSGRKTFSASEA